MKRQILSITKKELNSYFGSPLALIFLGTFLAAVLFIFFTIETFFARGIADVRPLFRWMPILLIFLLAALTMRQWSEEERSGTRELLLTLPVRPSHLVLGKFLAVMTLIGLALALTLPLPVTVSLIGNLDWGPVIGGYLAALLMAAAYAAIGLFVSTRTDNQIVALIATVLLGGLFYLVGTRGVTDFVGGTVSDILWAIGTGSRFESIQRGVIDLRDLVYYLSLTGVFLTLNGISLDAVGWSEKQQQYRRRVTFTTGLIVANLLLLNVWLYPLQGLRVDLTAGQEYTLSQTTEDIFSGLQEPLLIRAYISEKTHPVLAPLVPQIEDMLREYEIASDGRLTAEVIDPLTDPELEAEANQTYGIRPTTFQVSGRYEASVINSYFDILIQYGDQDVVLNFQDIVEITPRPDGTAEARLRNLEYDLTSSIRKVVYGFQSVDSVLAAMEDPVTLTLYITPQTLPEWMSGTQETIDQVAQEIAANSDGKLRYQVVDPTAPDSQISAQALQEQYGIQPYPVSLFGAQSYYAHLVLDSGEETEVIYPAEEATEAEVRSQIESALKRLSPGFLKVVGLWAPAAAPQNPNQPQAAQPLSAYQLIEEQLRQEYTVQRVDLAAGQVPADVDVLLVLEPNEFGDEERFAIDQYLMRGGSVVIAGSGYRVGFDQFQQGFSLIPAEGGLNEMLAGYGVNLEGGLVMDEQNAAFPVTVNRNVSGFQVQEVQAIDYPFFVDVRPDGMAEDNPVVSNLPAVTMNWATAVSLDEEANAERETAVLLRSSPNAWIREEINIQPNFEMYPEYGFPTGETRGSYPLAVSVRGQFDSFFQDKESPFAGAEAAATPQPGTTEFDPTAPQGGAQTGPRGVIPQSAENARLIVIGSAAFANDYILNLSSRLSGERYLNNLQFLQNSVDWAVEDLDLLAIRGGGTAVRVLQPMSAQEQSFWEVANYVLALAALIAIYAAWRARDRNEKPMELVPVEAGQ